MNPTVKTDKLDTLLKRTFGVDRCECIINNVCVICKTKNLTEKSFKDSLSLKEYKISGLCQKCQDKIFNLE